MWFDKFRHPFALEVWTLLTLAPHEQIGYLTPKWGDVHQGKLPPSQTKKKAPVVKRIGEKRRDISSSDRRLRTPK